MREQRLGLLGDRPVSGKSFGRAGYIASGFMNAGLALPLRRPGAALEV